MNCEEFRRRLLEDPACRAPDFLVHRGRCEPCDREAREVERLEAGLARLLRVPPPADLRHRLAKRPARRAWIPLAAAASLAGVLALGLSGRPGPQPGDAAVVAAEVVRHVRQEPAAFAARVPLPAARWRDLSPTVTVDSGGWTYPVTYAAPCELMQRPGLHLVLNSAGGPVTVLVIVDYRVEKPALLNHAGQRAVLRPLAGGTLAVLAEGEGVRLEDIAAAVEANIYIHG